MLPRVLDACCGSKMFWFNRNHSDAVYVDKRKLSTTLCDGRTLEINPDYQADFTSLPFTDNSFYMVILDPPHLIKAGNKSWLAKKYGKLQQTWQEDITQAFIECFRVLKPNGTLIFKWNEEQIKLSEILKLTDYKPLVGNRRSKTHWLVFMKDF